MAQRDGYLCFVEVKLRKDRRLAQAGSSSPRPSSGRCASPPSTTCWTTPPTCSPGLTSSKFTPPRGRARPGRRSATGQTRFDLSPATSIHSHGPAPPAGPDIAKVCESHELCQHKKPRRLPHRQPRPSPRAWPGTGAAHPETLPRLTPEMLGGPPGQALCPAGGG